MGVSFFWLAVCLANAVVCFSNRLLFLQILQVDPGCANTHNYLRRTLGNICTPTGYTHEAGTL